MTGFFARLARFVDDHRRLVLLLVVAALALSAWPLSHARFSGDLTDLLPDDSPAAGAFRKFRERFEQGDNLLVIAVAEPAAPAAGPTPQQWIAALRERVARLPEPLRIEGSPLERIDAFVQRVLPSAGFAFLTAGEAAALRETLTSAGIERALGRSLRLLEQSPGLDMSELVRRDPLCLRDLLAARAAQLFGGARPSAPDGRFALLSLLGPKPAQDLSASRAVVAAVRREIDALGRPPHLAIRLTGGYAIAVEDEAEVRGSLQGTTLSSILMVVLLQLAAYRGLARLFSASTTLLVGVAWAYAIFVALRGGITLLTAVGAAMLVGLADDYGVHFYSELLRAHAGGADRKTARLAMVARGGVRVAVGAFTSIGCFLAFGMTGFKGLSDLGLISGIGLITCLIAFLTLFPALLRNHVPRVKRTFVAHFADALAALPLRWPRATLGAAMAVTAGAVAVLALRGAPPFVSDLNALHTDRSPAMQALAELDRLVDRPLVPWVVLAEGATPEELADRFDALTPQLEARVADGTLVAWEPPTRALPTRRDQQAAFAALAGLDGDAVARTLREKADALGFAPGALAATEEMLRANLARAARGECVTLDELARLGAGGLVDQFFRRGPAGWTAAGYVFASGGLFAGDRQHDVIGRLSAALADAPGFALTGFQVVAYELTSRVRKDFRGVTALAIGVVVLLVLICSRSPGGTLLALLPVGVAFLWLLAAMQLRGLPFNVLNIVLLPMLVGLGVDYGIHLVFDARETGDVRASTRAVMLPMLVSAVTTVAGFGSLMGVRNPGVESMGELSAAGIAFTLIATIVVLAPLLRLRMRDPPTP